MFTMKQARQYAGFTQSEMAEKLGISRSSYMYLEKHADRATINQAKRISEVTGISLDNLFFEPVST